MAQDPPSKDLMNYEAMAQEALRGVVKSALQRASAPGGLPGAHHLYLTFKTAASGVEGPEDLLSRYPDEMTIVLQHQFWDLDVGDEAFGVTLKFGGRPQSLVVPYVALTRFYDPSVQFLLQFDAGEPTDKVATARRATEPLQAPALAEGETPNVVSLDHFRKK
ncbi:MAG: SspB family protein [Phenylobacterium sp.]